MGRIDDRGTKSCKTLHIASRAASSDRFAVGMRCTMKPAKALMIVTALLLAPVASAEEETGQQPEDEAGPMENYPHCLVFWYSLNPLEYNVSPECLFPLPPPIQEIIDELIDPES